MAQRYSRDELVARLVRAGELEVSGEHPDEVGEYFAPEFVFHGPGGIQLDHAGLSAYFESVRDAFADRAIRRGIMVVEGNTIACQTWIEGTFVREFTQSPAGPIPPNGRRIIFDLINIFQMDDDGRLVEEYVRADNRSLVEHLHAPARPESQG
jgi:predicted ester cyclase